jgi:phosphatidate cytidylyltransferase
VRRNAIKQRILSGAVLLPLLILFLFFASQGVFLALMLLTCLLAQREYQVMALPGRAVPEGAVSIAGGFGFLLSIGQGEFLTAIIIFALTLLLVATLFLFRHTDIQKVTGEFGLTMLGFCYLPLLLSLVVLLFNRPDGRQWVFFVLLVVMLADTFAYFIGSAIGRTPLYPRVSPNKSREGALGGILGSVIGGIIAQLTFFPELGWPAALLVAGLLSVCGQTGDLFESLLKRSFSVKDSGNLIPGHGGLLDRLDSLLFAFPAAFFFALLLQGH